MRSRKLELLSPARNSEIAIQAILHGADAVYIGPPTHGARKAASNSLEDIEKVVDFAHQYRAKVYATVNTIIYEDELKTVEALCRDLYHLGVDALIIQDMALLRMNIPPIALHASTQCDIRTPEKAIFLEKVGFSQLVLARELTINQIRDIADSVSIPVETFVHGALCVSYSGNCHASYALNGRSANRGECSQICRLPYDLVDADGKIIEKNKYLLSLKDFNASHRLQDLVNAGVSSFKIEGRLKDVSYVKNITSLYNIHLNEIIKRSSGELSRSSYGEVRTQFTPNAYKSFNRGFTTYFLDNPRPLNIASLLTPKSQGEEIKDVNQLNNGDGISFYDSEGVFSGLNVNKIENGRIVPARKIAIPKETKIYRTSDIIWEKRLASDTSSRKISVDIFLHDKNIVAKDERGVQAMISLDLRWEKATKIMDYEDIFKKLGNTPYNLKKYLSSLDPSRFYRASELTALRRDLIALLDSANKATYPFEYRRKEDPDAKYPLNKVDYRENISNSLSEKFYRDHGVTQIEHAAETSGKMNKGDVVMTTRHCILRELGRCKKEKGNFAWKFPLYIRNSGKNFRLDFDCNNCEMKVRLS